MGKPSLLIIEDDFSFVNILTKHLDHLNIDLIHKTGIVDITPISSITQFDVIVLNHHLQYLTGLEIANFVFALKQEACIIMVSSDKSIEAKLPVNIRSFYFKSNPLSDLVSLIEHEFSKLFLSNLTFQI